MERFQRVKSFEEIARGLHLASDRLKDVRFAKESLDATKLPARELASFLLRLKPPRAGKHLELPAGKRLEPRLEKLLKDPDFVSLLVYLYLASHPSLVTPLSYDIEVVDVP